MTVYKIGVVLAMREEQRRALLAGMTDEELADYRRRLREAIEAFSD